MMLKEYRICMPLTVEEYRIGQLYMIAKHSHEQSQRGEGVEVIKNEPCQHPDYGQGQYTEKRIYLSSRLPNWMQALIPNVFYITEKAWNFYPFTITEYTCSFLPRFSIHIETKYENNNGSSENSLGLSLEDIALREVDFIDIAYDPLVEKHYKEEEDCTKFKSKKTNRGPLQKGWRENTQPIMCSYKVTRVKFEVWGLQSRVEAFSHKISQALPDIGEAKSLAVNTPIRNYPLQQAIRDILQVGHKQAFAWIDEWIDMKTEDIRSYEVDMHKKTNQKVTARSNSVD